MADGAAPENGVVVRRASVEDAEALAGLRWTWSEEGLDPLTVDPAEYASSFAGWMRTHPDHLPFLATRSDEPVGMAWLTLVARVPDPRVFDRVTGDLQSVFVVPALRNAGVGAQLVEAVVALAREFGCTRVTVHSWERSIPLYDRHGFALDDALRLKPLD